MVLFNPPSLPQRRNPLPPFSRRQAPFSLVPFSLVPFSLVPFSLAPFSLAPFSLAPLLLLLLFLAPSHLAPVSLRQPSPLPLLPQSTPSEARW